MLIPHFISPTCAGEICTLCGQPATHKVGEEIPHDHPFQDRHNFTAYVCCRDFGEIFGPWAKRICEQAATEK